jgi:hypothetical protein
MTRKNKIFAMVPRSIRNAILSTMDVPKSDSTKIGYLYNRLSMEYVNNTDAFIPDLQEVNRIITKKEKLVRVTLNYDDIDYKKFADLANLEFRSLNKQSVWVLICIALKLKNDNIKEISLNDHREVVFN